MARRGPLPAYTVLWALSTPLEYLKGPLAGPPGGPWVVGLLLLCFSTAMFPENKPLVVVTFTSRIIWWLNRAPFLWASETIGGLTDLAVVVHILVFGSSGPNGRASSAASAVPADDDETLNNALGTSMRRQVAWFYFFAGFWKLNSSFLDHRYSCASVFMSQLLDAYVPPHLLSPALVHAAIVTSPAVTVIVECGIGILMLIGEYSSVHACRTAGVVLALVLHIGIDITPAPHNIANFSHKIGLRYLWFAPMGCAAAVHEAIAQPLRVGSLYVGLGACALAATVATQQPSVWAQWTSSPWDSLRTLDARRVDWHVGAHVALSALLVRGIFRGESSGRARSTAAAGTSKSKVIAGTGSGGGGASSESFLIHVNTLLCILWSFGTAVLGLTDNATPNMYSNLRQQGGSNHVLGVPMSLLQLWRYTGHGAGSDPFGGGLVRVEYSNSTHMAGYCPAETSAALSAGSVRLARQAGHSGRVFNPAFALNIGPRALPPRPDGPFVRYTLPAYELRRQLRDVRSGAAAVGEAFELIYTNLPGATGDEKWRAKAAGRTVKLVVHERGRESCLVLAAGSGDAESCQPDDLALAPFPEPDLWSAPLDAILGSLQSWNPQPILSEEQTEVHCYG